MSFKKFAHTVFALGSTSSTGEKLEALAEHLAEASDADKVWTIAIFSGRRPRRIITTSQLKQWSASKAGIPDWLFDECYHTVGDLAETIALLIAGNDLGQTDSGWLPANASLAEVIHRLVTMQNENALQQQVFIEQCWQQFDYETCFVFNKLITGGFRIGVSQKTMVKALEKVTGLESSVIAHRISGQWDPAAISFSDLLSADATSADASKPYPFYLSYPLEDEPKTLGNPANWQAEWKWDGIRGQIIKRSNEIFVWSRGEELMTDKFPEYKQFTELIPDGTVLDGEIAAGRPNLFGDFKPDSFGQLQTRIGRKNITRKILETNPGFFIAYDLLECEGADIRTTPLNERRKLLEALVTAIGHPLLQLSPVIPFANWEQLATLRQQSREMQSEGVMLKRLSSNYQAGRKVGDWWKWKIDPMVIDAVLIYAQKGHGRRSNLYTDYTFAVKDGDRLVPFAKAYSGLTDKEFAAVDAFVKQHAVEKFGPVRTVKPELVFEIAFEGIAASKRHKSGVALRFPRMKRWRTDKKVEDINTLEDLKKLLQAYHQ